MASMDKSEASALITVMKASSDIEIDWGDYTIKCRSGVSGTLKITYKDHRLLKESIDNVGPQEIVEALERETTSTADEGIGNWVKVEKSKYLKEWRTPEFGYPIYIKDKNYKKSFKIFLPNKKGRRATNAETLDTAVLRAKDYMRRHDAHQVEFKLKLKEVSEDVFEEKLTGVGPKKAEKLAEKGFTSWKEVKNRGTYYIASNYVEDFEKDAERQMEHGKPLTHHDESLKQFVLETVTNGL